MAQKFSQNKVRFLVQLMKTVSTKTVNKEGSNEDQMTPSILVTRTSGGVGWHFILFITFIYCATGTYITNV